MERILDQFADQLKKIGIDVNSTRDQDGNFGVVVPSPSTGVLWSLTVLKDQPSTMALSVEKYLNLIACKDESDGSPISNGSVWGSPLISPMESAENRIEEIENVHPEGFSRCSGRNEQEENANYIEETLVENDDWAELTRRVERPVETDPALRWMSRKRINKIEADLKKARNDTED